MYKVVQIVHDLPIDEENPLYNRRFLLVDDVTGQKVDLRAFGRKDDYSTVFGNQMFDVYGREIEIDPSITEICHKIGRWDLSSTDVETYLVRKADGGKYIAYVDYYFGTNTRITRWVSELSPFFGDNHKLKVRLICSNIEVLDLYPFSQESAIVHYYGDSEGNLWLVEKPFIEGKGFFLLQPDCTRILESIIFEKKTDEFAFSRSTGYHTFTYNRAGEILANGWTGRGEPIIMKTDAEFITSIQETDRSILDTIPFYYVSKDP